MAKYRLKQGLDYGDRRAEAGAVVDDIPAKSVEWLLAQGLIEEVTTPKKPKSADKDGE